MSDPVEFPESKKVFKVVVPIPAEFKEMLEIAFAESARVDGMEFNDLGEWLGYFLWNNEECGLKLLKEERDWSDPRLERFPGNPG